MLATPLSPLSLLVCSLALGLTRGALAFDDAAADKKADDHFTALLTEAKANPDKTDWKALRRAFAVTSMYRPYNPSWRPEVSELAREIQPGDAKKAEGMMDKVMERECFMRLDAHFMAVDLYEKLGQPEKAKLHRQFLEGIASTLFDPERGRSFEKPIEVLFIEEEYMFMGALKRKSKRVGLMHHEGHKFDVFELEATPEQPARQFFFNVDLLQDAAGRMLEKAGVGKDK